MNPKNFDESFNETNAKLFVISISCYSERKKLYEKLIKPCAKKLPKLRLERKLSGKESAVWSIGKNRYD